MVGSKLESVLQEYNEMLTRTLDDQRRFFEVSPSLPLSLPPSLPPSLSFVRSLARCALYMHMCDCTHALGHKP